MEAQLKTFYGKRTTPGVKLLMLIAIVLLGLYLVFGNADQEHKALTPGNTSVDVRHDPNAL